jgi:predicted protein tyrosine phosphatase
MNFKILSKQQVEEFTGEDKYILISISCNGEDKANLKVDDNRVNTLFLEFDDADKKIKGQQVNLFSRKQAIAIIRFVREHKDNVETIVANCRAGISRSSGVIAAIMKLFYRDDSEVYNCKKYFPNRFVYLKILKEGMKMGIVPEGDVKCGLI